MAPNNRSSPPAPSGITRTEVVSLLNVQKDALCDTLDHIARSNNEAIDRVLRMNNEALAKIGELTKSLEFAHNQLEDRKPITLVNTVFLAKDILMDFSYFLGAKSKSASSFCLSRQVFQI